MESSLDALEQLKSEISLRCVFNVRLSEAIHPQHSPCVRHLILKCNNVELELMNASNLPGALVIICFLCVPALRSTHDPVSAGRSRKLDGAASVCFAIFASLWVRHAGSCATCGL